MAGCFNIVAALVLLVMRVALADIFQTGGRPDAYVPCLSAQGCEAAKTSSVNLENHMARQFVDCFDRHGCLTAERTMWHHFTEDQPSCMTAARVWWSHKPSVLPVTLVTQLSIGRLDQLKALCASWRGPLAAAVYIPLVNAEKRLSFENLDRLAGAIGALHRLVRDANGSSYQGCQLRVALIYELFADARGAALLRPINSLRNYARLMADTDLIFNVDVGLLPSASISAALMNPRIVSEYTEGCRAGAAYVFPAFEASHCGANPDYAYAVARSGITALRQGLDKKCVSMFESKHPVFQNATQYARWLNSSVPYRVQYHLHYEPSYMSWRWTTPWFDARYRGYGYNKGVQAAAMNATGATWLVSPSSRGFLVHRPARNHSGTDEGPTRAPPVKGSDGHGLRDAMFGHLAGLWQAAMTGLNATGKIEVRVESSFGRCMVALPWWRAGRKSLPIANSAPGRDASRKLGESQGPARPRVEGTRPPSPGGAGALRG